MEIVTTDKSKVDPTLFTCFIHFTRHFSLIYKRPHFPPAQKIREMDTKEVNSQKVSVSAPSPAKIIFMNG
jgi:hypothetical protein